MKVLTLVACLFTLFVFSSCEKGVEQSILSEQMESSEKTFFFAADIKEGQEDEGYRFTATLDQVNSNSSLAISWKNEQDYYQFELDPAANEVRLKKNFQGKDCLDVAEFISIQRTSTLKLDVVQDALGKLTIAIGESVLFENTEEGFAPISGKYSTEGGLLVSKFNIF